MRKIFERIAGFAQNNIEFFLHVFVSMVLMLWLSAFVGWELGLFLTLLVGVGKELFDFFQPDNYASHKDFAADILGALLALIPLLLCLR